MESALLASVPCLHLQSVLELDLRDQVAAFGTGARSIFVDPQIPPDGVTAAHQKIPQGTLVLIYASKPAEGAWSKLMAGPKATVEGTFVRWVPANSRGRYDGFGIRPPTAEHDDTAWDGFWEVAHLRLCEKPVPFSIMRQMDSGKRFKSGFLPEHPMLIELSA